jgi:hypothetical protein
VLPSDGDTPYQIFYGGEIHGGEDKKPGGCLPSEQSRTIEGKIRRSGLSQQAYLLRAALEEPICVVGELKPILVELRGWGRNLNQLTVLAHTGRVQTVYLRECMEVLGKTYEAVNRLLTEKGGVISHGDV